MVIQTLMTYIDDMMRYEYTAPTDNVKRYMSLFGNKAECENGGQIW